MTSRLLVRTGWGLALLVFGASIIRYRDAGRRTRSPSSGIVHAGPDMPVRVTADSLLGAMDRVSESGLFASDSDNESDDGSTAPPLNPTAVPMRPTITLRGLLGGPPWIAVVQGLPGIPGPVVLRSGDTLAGFSIVRAGRDSVVLSGNGTSLTLSLGTR